MWAFATISHLFHLLMPSRGFPSMTFICHYLYPMLPNWLTRTLLDKQNFRGSQNSLETKEESLENFFLGDRKARITVWFLRSPGHREPGGNAFLWDSVLLSLTDIQRSLSLSLCTSHHPSFPCPCSEPWRESPDSLQGGASQKLPHPPYQTYLPARPRSVSCTVTGEAELRQDDVLRWSKLTGLKADGEPRPGHPGKPRAGQFGSRMLRGWHGRPRLPRAVPQCTERIYGQLQAGTSASISFPPTSDSHPAALATVGWLLRLAGRHTQCLMYPSKTAVRGRCTIALCSSKKEKNATYQIMTQRILIIYNVYFILTESFLRFI